MHMIFNQIRFISLVVLFVALTPFVGVAQQNSIKPKWIKETPKARNSSYEFKIFSIQAPSSREAKRMLPDEAAYYVERSFDIEGASVDITDVSQKSHNGQADVNTNILSREIVYTKAGKVNVSLRIISEYRTGGTSHFLCTMPNPNAREVVYDPVVVTQSYGALGLMSVIPGVGQFYKHQYTKGGLILGGCAALTGGVIFTEQTRADYASKIRQTHNATLIRSYTNKRNHYALARNICIGSAAALYLYNLVDAIVAPGAQRVIVKKNKHNSSYAFAPTISDMGAPMLVASVTF